MTRKQAEPEPPATGSASPGAGRGSSPGTPGAETPREPDRRLAPPWPTLILPALWRHYEHQPAMAEAPKTTRTAQGIPGDPLNVGLVGPEDDVVRSMLAAGWSPADPITLRSSLEIASSVVFRRPDPQRPGDNLYLFGRKQDLAFEKPVGGNARGGTTCVSGSPRTSAAKGSHSSSDPTTFDLSVGLSRDTGQITHHIAPDVDAQRDELIADLVAAGGLAGVYQVTGVANPLREKRRGRSVHHRRRADDRGPRPRAGPGRPARPTLQSGHGQDERTTLDGDPAFPQLCQRVIEGWGPSRPHGGARASRIAPPESHHAAFPRDRMTRGDMICWCDP